MPQWDFLDFLAAAGRKLPNFHLLMEHEVIGLIEDTTHRVIGVRANTPSGPVEIQANLVVGCDGRHSTTRADANLPSSKPASPSTSSGSASPAAKATPRTSSATSTTASSLVLINRVDYFQCAFIIAKDTFATTIQPAGIRRLPSRHRPASSPSSPIVLHELTDWDQVKLLSVQVNRLTRWYRPGLLCIGDAAHAMSPVGGIGINLAIQDAVAAARILSPVLSTGVVTALTLDHIQHRREFPTRVTQTFQVMVHRFISKFLGNPAPIKPPFLLRLLSPHPLFRRLTARFIGVGVRPEHIQPH